MDDTNPYLPSENIAAATRGYQSQVRAPMVRDVDFTDHTSDPADVAKAYWMNETIVGAAVDHLAETKAKIGARDPSFNQYAYYGDNKADYQDLDYFVTNGYFDSTRSPEEFQARADSIRRENSRKDVMANGGFIGHALGMGLSFLDVSTLVPFVGEAQKAKMLSTVGRTALMMGALTGGQEAVLGQLESTRTMADALENVGIGTALGGGLGLFVHTMTPKHVLAPDNPRNPLITSVPLDEGQKLSYSLSAAETPPEAKGIEFADKTGLGFVDWLGYKLRVPGIVTKRIVDDESRQVMNRIADAGIATKGNEALIPTRDSAEDILNQYENRYRVVSDRINQAFVGLNAAKGSGAFSTAIKRDTSFLGIEPPVSEKAWNDALAYRLNFDGYKTGDAKIDSALDSVVPTIREFQEAFHADGVQHGKFQPGQKIEDYLTQRYISHAIAENPDKFEAVLYKLRERQNAAGPDEDWLKENYGITRDQYEKLDDVQRTTGDANKPGPAFDTGNDHGPTEARNPGIPSKKDILEDWNYEGDQAKLRGADRDAEAAKVELVKQLAQFQTESRMYRKTETATRRIELKEAVAEVRAHEATLATEREKLEQMKLEERSVVEAATAAREKTLARQQQPIDVHQDAGADLLKGIENAKGELDRAKGRMDTALDKESKNPDVRPDFENSGEFAHRDQRIAQAQKKLDDLQERLAGGVDARKAPDDVRTPDVAAQAARAQEVGIARQKQEAKVSRMEGRLEKLRERLQEINTKADELRAARKRLAEVRENSRLALRKAEKDAQRSKARASALEKRGTFGDWVKETRGALIDRRKTPFGYLEDTVPETGRVKRRGIRLDREAYEELVQHKMIETDVGKLIYGYTRDMGGRLALRRKFGSEDLATEIKMVQENYNKRVADAKASGNDNLARQMAEEAKAAVSNVEVLRDRVLGRYGMPDDPSSALLYMGRMARMVNYLRFMGRVMISALADLATISLSHGLGRHLGTGFGRDIAKFAKNMKDREVQSLIFAAENGLLFSRHAKNLAMDELMYSRGIGTGLARTVTAGLEGGLRWATDRMALLNGMAWWNSRHKFIAGQVQLQNIINDAKIVSKGGKLPNHRMVEYARFGFSEDDLKGVGAMLSKHGEVHENGLIDPNGGAWLDEPGGQLLHNRMLTLLKRAGDEAVVTPTMTDTPAFMSKEAGKLLFQFQSFGFAAVNKYARNLRYKAVNEQGWDALMSVTFGLAAGAMSYALGQGVVKGQPLTDKPAQWVYEAIDRSGLTMFLSPMINSGLKLMSPAMNRMGMDWLDQPSRYAQSSWAATFFGPTMALYEDVQSLGTYASQGKMDKVGEKLHRLAPFSNLFYVDMLWRMANGTHAATIN